MGWVVDLDGVMWRGRRTIPGSVDAINRLTESGHELLFVTNAARSTTREKEDRLVDMGVDARGRVVTSAVAAGRLFGPADRVLVIGSAGLRAEIRRLGVETTDDPARATAVLVGFHETFDYAAMRRASTAVFAGARLVGTNHDPSFPTEDGLIPGNGALVAAIATATGVAPVFAGKPHLPMVETLRGRLGPKGFVVGDRPDSDGALARALGYRFGLVLSGVTVEAPDDGDVADVVGRDLRHVVELALGSPPWSD